MHPHRGGKQRVARFAELASVPGARLLENVVGLCLEARAWERVTKVVPRIDQSLAQIDGISLQNLQRFSDPGRRRAVMFLLPHGRDYIGFGSLHRAPYLVQMCDLPADDCLMSLPSGISQQAAYPRWLDRHQSRQLRILCHLLGTQRRFMLNRLSHRLAGRCQIELQSFVLFPDGWEPRFQVPQAITGASKILKLRAQAAARFQRPLEISSRASPSGFGFRATRRRIELDQLAGRILADPIGCDDTV
jgi:hypothetical protein